jgi:hypothetical protein
MRSESLARSASVRASRREPKKARGSVSSSTTSEAIMTLLRAWSKPPEKSLTGARMVMRNGLPAIGSERYWLTKYLSPSPSATTRDSAMLRVSLSAAR